METAIASIIVPTYNRERTILRSINSILHQTFQNFEIIVIDDGSADNTGKLLANIDPRITYHWQKNAGQNAARNKGLSLATGKYLFFLDSDDEWLPSMLEKHISVYKSNPNIHCVYNNVIPFNDGIPANNGTSFSLSGSVYKQALQQGFVSSMIGLSIRRECLDKVKGFDENFSNCDDDDFCFRLARFFDFFLIQDVLAIVHNDGGGRVTSQSKDFIDGRFNLYIKYLDDIIRLCGKRDITKKIMKLRKMYKKSHFYDGVKKCDEIIKKYGCIMYFFTSRITAAIKKICKLCIPYGIIASISERKSYCKSF